MKKIKKHSVKYLIVSSLLFVLFLAGVEINNSESTDREVKVPSYTKIPYDTPLDAVKWTGGFWHDRMQRLRKIYLPGVMDGSFMTIENGSTFRNFLKAAGREPGGATGHIWTDGDCYFVLDAVSRLYAYRPDEYLRAKLDYWISIIASIQQEDGLVDTWTILGDFDAEDGKYWRNKYSSKGRFSGWINYNTGHLYLAATSHKRATGDDTFMAIAEKALLYYIDDVERRANTYNTDGYYAGAQVPWAYGMRYARSSEGRFLQGLRRTYAGEESVFGPPLRDALEIFGHNTYTAHFLMGATALYGFTGEQALLDALSRLAGNLLSAKVFITGAVAPVQHGQRPELTVKGKKYRSAGIGEGVGQAYDLFNDSAYCESCGQCLYMEWLYRMFRLTGEAVYMDAAERALYNTVPGCVDLDRPNFFYCNPQEQGPGSKRRYESEPHLSQDGLYTWKRVYTTKCACCPPKVLRAIAMSAEIAYNFSDEGLWVNLYGNNTFNTELPWGGSLECQQTTDYPWDGKVKLVVSKLKSKQPFSIFLRIPDWIATPVSINLNGKVIEGSAKGGTYYQLNRKWEKGDKLEMEFPMPIRFMAADPRISDDRGKVAVMRGPVVYCVEDGDIPKGLKIDSLYITGDANLKPVSTDELGGITKLTGSLVYRTNETKPFDTVKDFKSDMGLYQEIHLADNMKTGEKDRSVQVSMIPYFARLNRESNYFKIWVPIYNNNPLQ